LDKQVEFAKAIDALLRNTYLSNQATAGIHPQKKADLLHLTGIAQRTEQYLVPQVQTVRLDLADHEPEEGRGLLAAIRISDYLLNVADLQHAGDHEFAESIELFGIVL